MHDRGGRAASTSGRARRGGAIGRAPRGEEKSRVRKRASSPGYPPQKKHRAENVLVAVGLPHHHGVGVGDLAGGDHQGLVENGGDGGKGGHGD